MPTEKVLTPEAQAERDDFEATFRDGHCNCHISPPCSSCIHPGNPRNQEEDDSAWVDAPYVAPHGLPFKTQKEEDYADEINKLRNVIQSACIGGTSAMLETWKRLFPDAGVPTVSVQPNEFHGLLAQEVLKLNAVWNISKADDPEVADQLGICRALAEGLMQRSMKPADTRVGLPVLPQPDGYAAMTDNGSLLDKPRLAVAMTVGTTAVQVLQVTCDSTRTTPTPSGRSATDTAPAEQSTTESALLLESAWNGLKR